MVILLKLIIGYEIVQILQGWN